MQKTGSKPTRSAISREHIVGGIPTRSRPTRLRLYIAGSHPRSLVAVETAKKLCAQIADCTLEVLDIYASPEAVRRDNVLAVPALIRVEPPPPITAVGKLWDAVSVGRRLGFQLATA